MRVIVRRARHPVEERLPDFIWLSGIQAAGKHSDPEEVIGCQESLLSPMMIEQMFAVMAHELADQAPIGIIGSRLYGEANKAEELGELMQTECQFTDRAETAASASLQRPEQLGVSAGIGDPNRAVCSNDFGFQETPGSGSIVLGETAKATALDQARQADRGAPAALNIFAALGCHRGVRLHPDNSGASRDRGLRRKSSLAPLRNERGMHRDVVHLPCPDQERVRRIRCPLETVPATLDH